MRVTPTQNIGRTGSWNAVTPITGTITTPAATHGYA